MVFKRFHIRNTFRRLMRYRHITAVLVKYGLEEAASAVQVRYRMRFKPKATARQKEAVKHKTRPQRFRMALEELGPTFIKFGQLLSTRPDLIPAEYAKELENLQDKVTAQKTDNIFDELEQTLGGNVDDIFKNFDKTPIAAGSIAQVYRAELPTGQKVVVKIRRPNIARTISTECEILEDIAGLLKVTMFGRDTVDPKKIVAEFTEAVSKEVDLAIERKNQMRFIQAFADSKSIHIPQVYEDYCSQAVLTMEYIEGVRPANAEAMQAANINPKIIAARGADFVMKQIFEMGFFHADPHPGNFFLLADNVLVPIDYGQTAKLSSQDRDLLKQLILTIIDNNADDLINSLLRIELIDQDVQINQLKRDIEMLLDSYYGLPLKDIPVSNIIMQTFDIIRKYRISPPPQFSLMLKCLMTIESFAKSLDPKFNIIDAFKPYAKDLAFPSINPKQAVKNLRTAVQGMGKMASRLPDDFNTMLDKLRRGNFQMKIHHEHLENLTHTLDKSSNRISFALIIAALLIASSMLISQTGDVLGIVTLQTIGIIGYIAAAIIGIWLLISIIRSRHY